MSFLSQFLKPRIRLKNGEQPVNTYVPGDVFNPGAESFAYEPTTTTTPDFLTRVYPQWNFTPLEVTQTEMNLQLLSLPPSLLVGFPFGGFQPTSLIQSDDYPRLSGDYYD